MRAALQEGRQRGWKGDGATRAIAISSACAPSSKQLCNQATAAAGVTGRGGGPHRQAATTSAAACGRRNAISLATTYHYDIVCGAYKPRYGETQAGRFPLPNAACTHRATRARALGIFIHRALWWWYSVPVGGRQQADLSRLLPACHPHLSSSVNYW